MSRLGRDVVMSTSEVTSIQAFDYWREMICSTFVQLTADPVSEARFSGEIAHTELGDVELSTVVAGAQHVRRTPRLVALSHEEFLLASIQLRGRGRVEQDGSVAILDPGCVAFYDSTRPYTLHFDAPFEQLVVQVPLPLLLDAAGLGRDTRTITARRLSADGPGQVISGFFTALAAARRTAPAATVPLFPHAVELLGVALRCAADGVPSSSAVAVREQVVAYLSRHLHDPTLDVDRVVAACHTSRRTLYRLFQADRGVAAYLRHLRIERAKSLLVAHPDRAVSAVARACGFSGESQFHRAFRAATGITPSGYRNGLQPAGGTSGH